MTGIWYHTTESVVKRYEELCIKCNKFLHDMQSFYMNVTDVMTSVDVIYRWVEVTNESLINIEVSSKVIYLIQQIYEIKVRYD